MFSAATPARDERRADVAYVALGSNLGDRARHLADALERMGEIPGVVVLRASPVEETEPLGPPGQGRYLNQMVALRTTLSPRELLEALQSIERAGGRVRAERWGPRTIDLDIVAFGRRTCDESGLVVPHPALAQRDFWQRELAAVRE